MRIPLRSLSPVAVSLCEVFGLTAFLLTPELNRVPLLAAVGAVALLFLARVRLGDFLLFPFVGGTVVAGIAAGAFSSYPISQVLSLSTIGVHGLLWLSAKPKVFRFWRLGIAFLEIVLASILAPETHMFLLIFSFVLVASLALSFGFLERNFVARWPEALERPVRPGFLGAVVALAFVIFLSSLLIFPLLPRSNWSGMGRNWAETGYTEEVSFQGQTLAWAQGSSRPLVWVFLPPGISWEEAVPQGLLRGKVLENFDGLRWWPASKQISRDAGQPTGTRLEIYREPMHTDILPVPYGTALVEKEGKKRARYASGEWPAPAQRNRRLQYEAVLGKAGRESDAPKKVHRKFPAPDRFAALRRLAAELKSGTRNDSERVEKVVRHLSAYQVSLLPMAAASDQGAHPVEHFLFSSKEGHCELFATAAALLFRSMGMPSRLVAGFRSTLPSGAVLTVRNTDAHAWVEVYVAGKGWLALDPTPFLRQPSSWMDPALEIYEYVNAYWHRFILGYEFDSRQLLLLLKEAAPLRWAGILLALFLLYSGLKKMGKRAGPREAAASLWERAERKARRSGLALADHSGWKGLESDYRKLRFGRELPTEESLVAFERRAAVLIRAFARERAGGNGN